MISCQSSSLASERDSQRRWQYRDWFLTRDDSGHIMLFSVWEHSESYLHVSAPLIVTFGLALILFGWAEYDVVHVLCPLRLGASSIWHLTGLGHWTPSVYTLTWLTTAIRVQHALNKETLAVGFLDWSTHLVIHDLGVLLDCGWRVLYICFVTLH